MKLKEFNKTNSTLIRMGKPQVSVNCVTGVICFTKDAIELLKLDENKFMKIMQDEDTGDWYLAPTNISDGFNIHNKTNLRYINNTSIAKSINKDISERSATYIISQNAISHGGYSLFLIIRKSAIVRNSKK